MIESAGPLGLTLLLFVPSLALTVASLWLAARLTPWFLKQRQTEPPNVRSFFFDFVSESEPNHARMTTVLIAAGIILSVLTPVVCLIRLGGIAI